MRRISSYGLVLLLCLTVPSPSVFGQERQSAAVQREIWNAKEAYWRFLKEKKQEAFMSLWHEQFVGWPTGMSVPADKTKIRTHWYPSLTTEKAILSYDLKPMAFRVHGNTAVVYLSVQLRPGIAKALNVRGPFLLRIPG